MTLFAPSALFLHVPLLVLLSLASCSTFTDASAPEPPARIAAVESFATYFADPWRDTLATFDLVILDPDNRSEQEIRRLHAAGAQPIAYVNLGEAETYRYFWDQVEDEWLLGPNPNWPDHYYVDARAEGWRRLLLDTVIPNIMDKGFEGLFFDMVDTALPGLHPETRPGMIQLIQEIRRADPESLLLMNNGLFLVDEVETFIDALVVENVFTRYDFDNDRYVRTASSERRRLVSELHRARQEYGLRSFLLNYAGAGTSPDRAYALQHAQEARLLTFVSTVELDTIFPPPASP
jgi:uncharacterized protein (TIGR01370 family)